MVSTLRACCAADDSLLGRERNDCIFADQSGEDFPIFFFRLLKKCTFCCWSQLRLCSFSVVTDRACMYVCHRKFKVSKERVPEHLR